MQCNTSIVIKENHRQALYPIICSIDSYHSRNYFGFFKKTLGPKLTHAEGMILGTAAKMFTIAGPVIVYGVSASVVYGFIYWITTLF